MPRPRKPRVPTGIKKQCTTCKVEFDKCDMVRTRCYECHNLDIIARQRLAKLALLEAAGGACELCGRTEEFILGFYPKEEGRRTHEVRISHQHYSLEPNEKVLAEIERCDLLCRNCAAEQCTKGNNPLKNEAVYYAGGCCTLCGYDTCVGALEFHHMDPTGKNFEIANRKAKNLIEIMDELDKCVLVCSNCHCLQHFRERNEKYHEQYKQIELMRTAFNE